MVGLFSIKVCCYCFEAGFGFIKKTYLTKISGMRVRRRYSGWGRKEGRNERREGGKEGREEGEREKREEIQTH